MLVDDPNKHFGFLDKSRRFKDIVDSEKDRDQVYKDLTSSNAGDKRGNHERIGSLNHIESPSDSIETKKKNDWQDRYDKMEILKLKLENERLEQVYQKQIQSTRKELNATLEKCAKLEAALQSTVKEKIAISGTTTSKEKDYQDLLHKHASLLQKLEKLEKVNISLNEKQKKSNLLEKKVQDLEKQQTRVNTEKNEQLNSELQKMKQKYLQVIDEKDRLVEELAHVSAEKRSLKLAQDNFSRELSSSKQIYDRHEKKLKEELKEYSNKYQLLEAKYDTQKHEFKSQIQKYCSENEKLMNESKNLKKSTEKQKEAYLERINGLETDLGITEKSLFDKDAKIDKLQVELSALKQEFSNKKFGHESATAENIRLKEQFEKSQQELLAANNKVSSLEEKLNSVRQSNESTLLDYRNKCSSLENELLKKSEEVKAQSHKISKTKEDIEQIKSAADFELKSIESKLTQKEEILKKLRTEIDRNDETIESIHRNHSATIQALKNDVDEANAHNQQLESLLSEAKMEFRDFKAKEESNRQNLESTLDSAKKSLKNITDSFTNEISALTRQIEAKSSKCGQLEAEINSLKSQLLEKGSHNHNEISNLLKLVDELKLDIKEKDEEFMVELQSLNFKLSAAESRYVELQDSKDEEITLLNVERVKIEGSLNRAIAESENFQNQYRAQTALLRETDLKLQRLKQSSDHSSIKSSEEIRALHRNIELLEAEKATFLSNFEAERERLEETASKLSKEHKSQLDGLAEKNKLLQFQLEELQTENNILEDSKCKIQAQLLESVSKFSETQDDVNNSRQQLLLELSDLKTERDSLREQNRELSSTAEKFSSCLKTSEKELEAARDEVRNAQAALKSQTARASILEQEFTELKSCFDKSSIDYQTLEQELERSLREGALLESVCKQRSNEIASLVARVDTFTQEKRAYLSKIQELDENYKEAQKESGRIQLELHNLSESSKIERKRLDCTISELKVDNGTLQQELVIVQDKLVECQAMILKNASGHEDNVQSLRRTELALQEQIQEGERLAKSLEIAKGDEKVLKEKLDQLKNLHAETLAQSTKKKSEFEQQIESLKAEKGALENKLLFLTSQLESYDSKWTDLDVERAALNLQIKDLELKIQASKSNEEELVRNCEAKRLALEEEQEMAEEQRILFAEKQCALQSELEYCKKSLEFANSNFETANANLQKLSVESVALKTDNEQKAEELKTAEEELSSALSRLMENQRNHNEKVKQLSDNIREKEIHLLRLQESLDVTKKTMEDVLIEKGQLNLKLETEMSSSLVQINKLKDNLELISVQLESKSLCYSKLEEERSNLAVKLKQKEDQLTTTFKSVTVLESTKLQLLAEVKTLELKIEKSEVAKVEFEGKYHSASNEVMALQQELEFVKSSSKAEFDELRERIKESKSNGYRDGAKFEKSVQELSERLAERNVRIKVLESDLDDAKAINSRAELRLMNETSSRDLSIRNLEAKLREKTRMVDKATEEKLEIERQLYEKDLYIKTVLQEEFEDKLSLAKKIWDQERSLLERDLHDWELREQELFVEIDKLKIELDEAELKYENEKANFDIQLNLLSERGKLHESEAKKISELNAELFGHSNTKQKIKHMAHLKEENIGLKEANLATSRERDQLLKRLQNTERAFEALKSVGIVAPKKLSRNKKPGQQSMLIESEHKKESLLGENRARSHQSVHLATLRKEIAMQFEDDPESLPKRWQKQVLATTKHMVAKGALDSPKKLRFQIPDAIKQGLHPIRQSSRVLAKRVSHRKPAQGSKSSKLIGLPLPPKAGSNRRFHARSKTARKSNHIGYRVRGDASFEAPDDNFVESAFRIFAGIDVADLSSYGAELAPEYEEDPTTIQEQSDHVVCNHFHQFDELEKLNQELSSNLNQSKKQVFYVENLLNVANEDGQQLKKELKQYKGPADAETSEVQSSLEMPMEATETQNSIISVLEQQLLDSQGHVAILTSEIQTLNAEKAQAQQKSNLQVNEMNNLLCKSQEQHEEYLQSVQQLQAEKEYLISDLNSVTSLNQELQVMLQAKVDEIENKNRSIGELLDRIQDHQSSINNTLDIEREYEQRNVDYEQKLRHRTLEFQKTYHALDFAESEILNLHTRIGAKDEEINMMRVLAQEIMEASQKLVGRGK